MLWALIQGWCGDVAAALASHAADVEPSVQMAANAAAGRWPSVVSADRAELLDCFAKGWVRATYIRRYATIKDIALALYLNPSPTCLLHIHIMQTFTHM